MSQESDCTTCSQLSISQETMDIVWKSMSDLTNACNYTQLASRDPVHLTDLAFSVDNGDTTLLIDKFQIGRGCSADNNLHTDQLKDSSNVLLETSHFYHKENNSNSSNVLQRVDVNTIQQLPVFPSNVQFSGTYNFQMLLSAQSKDTKAVDWTYSELLHKVYVRFAQSCPFCFRTDANPPPGTMLRAMPVYTRPQHAKEVARRCPHHSEKSTPDNSGVLAPPTHLIRCDHKSAHYEEDTITGFHSVIVPYEHLTDLENAKGVRTEYDCISYKKCGFSVRPPILKARDQASDEKWTIYLYQFMCFSSCVGGLNRRPVQVVFSLESADGTTLGRQAIEVRICACPGRDRHADEKNHALQSSSCTDQSPRVAITNEIMTVGPPVKRRRVEEDELFTLSVLGREHYEILLRLRDSLEVSSAMPRTQFERIKERQEEMRKSQSCVQSSADGCGVNLTKSSNQKSDQFPSNANFTAIKSEIPETDVDRWLLNYGLSTCSFAFRCHKLFNLEQLYGLTLEGFEKLGLSEQQLASVWLAVSRDRKRREVNSTTTFNSVLRSEVTDSVIASDKEKGRQPGDLFEVTRYTFKRRLSLPKENDCS